MMIIRLLVVLLALLFAGQASAQSLSPMPVLRFVDNNGNSCSGCKIFTFAAGTTSKLASYTDSTGGTPNTNPIILNVRGEASVWLSASAYKIVLSPSTDSDPPTNAIWTVDNVSIPATQLALPGPANWANQTIYDAFRVSVNNYPIGNEFGSNIIAIPSAIVGAINIPATAVSSPSANGNGIAGYASSASVATGAVGVFGFGGTSVSGNNSWGVNALVANCPSPNAPSCPNGSGVNGGGRWGAEVDVNIYKVGTANPTNESFFGVQVIGITEATALPGGIAIGFDLQPLIPINGGTLQWGAGFDCENNATINCLVIGSQAPPGVSVPSQTIVFHSYINATTLLTGSMFQDGGGNWTLNTAALGNVIFESSGTEMASISPGGVNIFPNVLNVGGGGGMPPTGPPSTLSGVLNINAYNPSGTLITADLQLQFNSALIINTAPTGAINLESGGIVMLQGSGPVPGVGGTSVAMLVNNNAGVNLVAVSIGSASSCGSARCLTVPN
jgi:hypothetical protein